LQLPKHFAAQLRVKVFINVLMLDTEWDCILMHILLFLFAICSRVIVSLAGFRA